VYIHIYICNGVCICIYEYFFIYITHIYIWIYSYINTHLDDAHKALTEKVIHLYIYIYIHIYAYPYMYMFLYVSHTSIYTYINIYTHTSTMLTRRSRNNVLRCISADGVILLAAAPIVVFISIYFNFYLYDSCHT